ncbi:Fic family protein [Dysgonomonas sp. 216]|uniref:Fic family protein n=1 Tax=Dysgonomonas sp. 216 TaxID=2302934 RepID=UPI0013D373B2|nr:Fic family protein [Dysgonomonas sp. 216]NDW19600.1 Fic family protein [Dysgonomonas sp. 216]
MYIHQHKNWTNFTWDNNKLLTLLANVRHLQGRLLGQMENLGFKLKEEAVLSTLTLDVLKSTEIEGEILNKDQVRSSIARKLGLEVSGLVDSPRDVDGVVEMMLDATQNYMQSITTKRLFGWHAALFPTGYSGMYKIEVGKYRNGDMQVVSGAMGKEKIHYEAPEANQVESEMNTFLEWFNNTSETDPVLKAAIAHFWFVTVHPFDDGNGRIARAITDMQLARSDGSPQRFYSMSSQILTERKKYYEILEKTQRGTSDITNWLVWFLSCLENALINSGEVLDSVLVKAKFWEKHSQTSLNDRQRFMLNKLLDGFDGKLTSSKWAKMAKTSQDTAIRDIQDLMDKGILRKEAQGGRSTNYELIIDSHTVYCK